MRLMVRLQHYQFLSFLYSLNLIVSVRLGY
ncbi:hypothetical protein CIPAW_08G001900 [Carya illinoinensis]|uniref:Uncharacterized protein n=1 Tax=Carya illinoinensis TaxID=32201 RepID=A0A8T1PPK2_CARIL|nr:hypothetical protein CIPAW_08G001900 [Carya illinoinensis]